MPSQPAANGLRIGTRRSRRLRKESPARSASSKSSSERADSASGQAARARAAVAELAGRPRPSSARQQEDSAALPVDQEALLSVLEAALGNKLDSRLAEFKQQLFSTDANASRAADSPAPASSARRTGVSYNFPEISGDDPRTRLPGVHLPQVDVNPSLLPAHVSVAYPLQLDEQLNPLEPASLPPKLAKHITAARDVIDAEVYFTVLARVDDCLAALSDLADIDDVQPRVYDTFSQIHYSLRYAVSYLLCSRLDTLKLPFSLCSAYQQMHQPSRSGISMFTDIGQEFARQLQTRNLNITIGSGEFHGVMAPTTPIGSRRVKEIASPGSLPCGAAGRVAPSILVGQPA